MDKANDKLESLLTKKSKIGKEDMKQASILLYDLFSTNNNIEEIVDYMYKFYYKVSGIFFDMNYSKLSEEDKNQIIVQFIKEKRFHDNKAGSSIYTGFCIIEALLNNDSKDENVFLLLNNLTLLAEKTKFNKLSNNTFKNFLENSYEIFFNLNFHELSELELKRLFRYMSAALGDISNLTYGTAIINWMNMFGFSVSPEIYIEINKSDSNNSDNKDKLVGKQHTKNELNNENNGDRDKELIVKPTEEGNISNKNQKNILSKKEDPKKENKIMNLLMTEAKNITETLEKANVEAAKLFNSILTKNNTINNLEEKLKEKDEKIYSLEVQIGEYYSMNIKIENEMDKLTKELSGKNAIIENLNERLKISFKADDITKKQDLITMKKDIASSIKRQYKDFIQYKNEDCNEDNYEALKVTINQVFRALIRNGIELEQGDE